MDGKALRVLSMLCEVSQTVKHFLNNQDCFEMNWWRYSRRQLAVFLLLNECQIDELVRKSYDFEQKSNRHIRRRHFGPIRVPVTPLNTDDMTVKIYDTFMVRVLFNSKAEMPYENHGEKIYLSTHLGSDLKSLCCDDGAKYLFIHSYYVPCTQPVHSKRPACCRLLADAADEYRNLRIFISYELVHSRTKLVEAEAILHKSSVMMTQLSSATLSLQTHRSCLRQWALNTSLRLIRSLLSWLTCQPNGLTTLVSRIYRNIYNMNP